MNLIRKLGFDFFNEKFSKGMYVLDGSLYLVLGAVNAKKEGNKEIERELRNLEAKKREARAYEQMAEQAWRNQERWDAATIDEALSSPEWDEDAWDDVDDFMEVNGGYPEREEYRKAWDYVQERRAVTHDLREQERVLRERLAESTGFSVRSIDFANKKIVDIDENEFQSIRMFWDFPEGYRVLRTWRNTGTPIWLGPSLNGARCIKLERRGHQTTRPPQAKNDDELHLQNYGFYLEEDRWKDILFPQPVSLEEALKDLKDYHEVSKHHENAVLLEGAGTILVSTGDLSGLHLRFQNRIVALMNYEGKYEKVKKGLLAIAVKQGAICQPKK